MQIKTRLKTVTWFAAIIAILVILVSVWTDAQQKQTLAQHDLAEEMISTAYKRSAVRAEYFLNREERPREQWLQLTDTLSKLIGRAQALSISPEQKLILQQIGVSPNKARTLFTHLVENRREMANGTISDVLGQEIEYRISAQFIIDSQTLLTQLVKLQKLADQDYVASQTRSNRLYIFVILTMTGFTVISLMMVARSIAVPIGKLKEGIAVIATGKFDYRIEAKGNDELSELARAGNEMAARLAASYTSVENLQQEVTVRKQAEQEILKLSVELEQRVIERTAQLEAANKELEAFAYSVSHDLRAPLRAIDGYTRILLEEYVSRLDAEGKRIGAVISESARDMGKLIDDLLAFSRIGRTAMQPSTIDMATMARSLYFEITTPADRERIDFRVGPLPSMVGDPTLFRQVWMNLLSNAVKFSSKKERATIEVSAGEQGGEVVYSVRDNGAGFEMQHADKLFGVFQRLHSTREFEGTGVGLAIAQRIILRHGGRIWGEGETGQGATFHFTPGKGE